MLREIMNILNTSAILLVDDLAEKLDSDRQSVLVALEQLQRMGYIADISRQSNDSGQCSKNCNGCSGCKGTMHKIVGRIYSIP